MLGLSPITSDTFSVAARLAESEITVKCAGNGGMDATPLLSRYLKDLHAEASRLSARRVVVDFRELYFMNSSCFKCFAVWLSDVIKSDSGRYAVRFVSNAQLHWQKRSLEALRCLAPQLVEVQSEPS
jgi:hypothetical protein